MNIDKILQANEREVLTRGELFIAAGQCITSDTVETVMAKIPPDLRDEFIAWALKTPAAKEFVIGSNLTREAAAKIEAMLENAKAAIRSWLTEKNMLSEAKKKPAAAKA